MLKFVLHYSPFMQLIFHYAIHQLSIQVFNGSKSPKITEALYDKNLKLVSELLELLNFTCQCNLYVYFNSIALLKPLKLIGHDFYTKIVSKSRLMIKMRHFPCFDKETFFFFGGGGGLISNYSNKFNVPG